MPSALFRLLTPTLLLLALGCSMSPHAEGPDLGSNPDLLGPNVTPEVQYGQFFVGPGDQVRLDFLRHEELNKQYRVRPDGTLYCHLVGPVAASGMTQEELRDLLAERYGEYLVNPSLYLEVEYSPSRKVAVQGYVDKPSVISLTDPQTTVLDVIALAGGVSEEGDKTAILIARRVEGKVQVRHYDMEALFAPDDPEARVEIPYVQPGDYVYVLRTWQGRFDEEVSRWTELLRGVAFLERDLLNAPRATEALQGDFSEDNF